MPNARPRARRPAPRPERNGTSQPDQAPPEGLAGSSGHGDGSPAADEDAVLRALTGARAAYRANRDRWERQAAAVRDLEGRLAALERENAHLARQLQDRRDQLDLERRRAEARRRQAEHLATLLKDIHRALLAGDAYDLILRACLSLTQATRGVYLTARVPPDGPPTDLDVRAAVDVDGYPDAPPSPFLTGLALEALADGESRVCNAESDWAGLPAPAREAERMRNCVVAPVALLRELSGVVIVADRREGDFDLEHAELLVNIGDQAAVAVENVHVHRQVREAYLETIASLAEAVETRDPYTSGRCRRVAADARRAAAAMGLPREQQSLVCYAALLHDVGKVGVTDGALNKPGPLRPEEHLLVRAHPRIGYDLLRRVPLLADVAEVVLHHHEWWDGHGYPDGLRGEAIPLASRIVGVADAYGAMRAQRAYRVPYSDAEARAELRRCAGSQFDPQVVEVFLRTLDARPDDADEGGPACGPLPGLSRLREVGQGPARP